MPDTPAVDAAKAVFQSISVDQIKPSRHQARKVFNEEAIKGLAESMKQETLLQPITVRIIKSPLPMGEGGGEGALYELISGERRFRAAKLLGWTTIDAKVIQTVSEGEAAAKGLIENLQRQDLNPIEEAEGFAELNKLDPTYWTQAKIAEISGKKQSHISETLRFLKLPETVKENIRQRIIGQEHAAELLRLPTQDLQTKVAASIEKNELSRNQTRALVNKLIAKAPGKDVLASQAPAGLKTDPLADRWKELKMDLRMESAGSWGVAFKKGQWIFTVNSAGVGTPEALTTWFRQIAEALGKAVPAPSDDPDSQDAQDSPEETAGVMAMQKRAKLPKTAEEEAELYALAAKSKGPGPIYAKLYGPLNPLTRLGETMTWAQFQVTDPKEGLRQLLDAIRKAQGKKP